MEEVHSQPPVESARDRFRAKMDIVAGLLIGWPFWAFSVEALSAPFHLRVRVPDGTSLWLWLGIIGCVPSMLGGVWVLVRGFRRPEYSSMRSAQLMFLLVMTSVIIFAITIQCTGGVHD